MVNLSGYTRFGGERKDVEKCDRTKRPKLRAVNWGNLRRPVHSDFSWCPFVCGDKDAPFLQVWEGHLSQEGHDRLQRKVLHVAFLTFFQLEIPGTPMCHILGLCVLNPIIVSMVLFTQ